METTSSLGSALAPPPVHGGPNLVSSPPAGFSANDVAKSSVHPRVSSAGFRADHTTSPAMAFVAWTPPFFSAVATSAGGVLPAAVSLLAQPVNAFAGGSNSMTAALWLSSAGSNLAAGIVTSPPPLTSAADFSAGAITKATSLFAPLVGVLVSGSNCSGLGF